MSIDELRTWLYLAKFRHSVPGVFKGWTFGDFHTYFFPPDFSSGVCYNAETFHLRTPNWRQVHPLVHINSLGTRMCQVLYENKFITLSTLGSWLLAHTHNELESPPQVHDMD